MSLYRKVNKLECVDYRGIAFVSSAYKIVSRILFKRLRPLKEFFFSEYPVGFLEGQSTRDQMFNVRQILHKFSQYNLTLLFIDFKTTYVSVKINKL